jgi:hypothetical protein
MRRGLARSRLTKRGGRTPRRGSGHRISSARTGRQADGARGARGCSIDRAGILGALAKASLSPRGRQARGPRQAQEPASLIPVPSMTESPR